MPRNRLSPLDASFLYMDGPVSHNQGAAMTIIDGPLDFHRLCDEMRIKVGRVDRLRQIPVFSPLNLFHPTWEFDPAFDISNHVREIDLPAPAREDQVRKVVEEIFSTRLSRQHPLWRVYIVNGLPDGRTVHVLVSHHSMSDGIGFTQLAPAFFDAAPQTILAAFPQPELRPLPGVVERVVGGAMDGLLGLPSFLSKTLQRACSLMYACVSKENRELRHLIKRFRTAPALRLPFNAPLSGQPSFAHTALDLENIARIRAACGGTLNDILLAVVTDAVNRYAIDRSIDTEGKFLRILIPSNVRTENTRASFGNFVALAPVIAPLGKMSALTRLHGISDYTRTMKQCGLANFISSSIALSQSLLMPTASRLAHRFFASSWLQHWTNRPRKAPSFNIVVTNVPGPTFPIYVAGQTVLEINVLVPLLPSIGLVCGAVSHNGHLNITFTGDKKTVTDFERFPEYVQEAFRYLVDISCLQAVAE